MRLIYADEAGISAQEPYCAVASVIVEGDQQFRRLQAEIARIVAENVPESLRSNFVFHATEVFSGGKKIDRNEWPFDDRVDFMKEIVCLPFVHDVPIAIGITQKYEPAYDAFAPIFIANGIKPSFDCNTLAHWQAFAHCMERSDYFLRHYLAGKENGAVVAEDVPQMRSNLKQLGLKFRGEPAILRSGQQAPNLAHRVTNTIPPHQNLRIDHIIDVPHFVEKGRAPLLQLADACAFAFRHYLADKRAGKDLILAMLGPVEGTIFIADDTWKGVCSAGLFNLSSFWTEKQMKIRLQLAAHASSDFKRPEDSNEFKNV